MHLVKRIKHVSELPKWYDLAKYKAADQLNALEWYWQLTARLELDNFVSHLTPSERSCGPDDPRFSDSILKSRELIEEMRCGPILDLGDRGMAEKFLNGFLTPPAAPEIGLASLGDISRQLEKLPSSTESVARKFLGGGRGPYDSKLINSPLSTGQGEFPNDVLINVSLALPEKLLIENFTTFIRSAKRAPESEDGFVARYRKPDFKEWIRLGLLPYIDLTIWEKEEDVTIPYRVMADAIFPSGEGGEEIIRKTTSKLANQLFQKNTLNALAILHAIEEADNRT